MPEIEGPPRGLKVLLLSFLGSKHGGFPLVRHRATHRHAHVLRSERPAGRRRSNDDARATGADSHELIPGRLGQCLGDPVDRTMQSFLSFFSIFFPSRSFLSLLFFSRWMKINIDQPTEGGRDGGVFVRRSLHGESWFKSRYGSSVRPRLSLRRPTIRHRSSHRFRW